MFINPVAGRNTKVMALVYQLLQHFHNLHFRWFCRYETLVGTVAKKFRANRKRSNDASSSDEDTSLEKRAKRGFIKPRHEDDFEFWFQHLVNPGNLFLGYFDFFSSDLTVLWNLHSLGILIFQWLAFILNIKYLGISFEGFIWGIWGIYMFARHLSRI